MVLGLWSTMSLCLQCAGCRASPLAFQLPLFDVSQWWDNVWSLPLWSNYEVQGATWYCSFFNTIQPSTKADSASQSQWGLCSHMPVQIMHLQSDGLQVLCEIEHHMGTNKEICPIKRGLFNTVNGSRIMELTPDAQSPARSRQKCWMFPH